MNYNILHGDCRELMATLDENSVDAIVTDPPYELGFMGKSWDASGVAFDVNTWQQALRVLKPGGHLIAFSGSRTYHRMAVAIEDAGFEIRDQIMWVYGSGFPKSHNIEKAINKIDGVEFIEKPASGVGFMNAEGAGGYNTTINQLEQVGDSTERASEWSGWGTALKPAHEPMVLARKPLIGTVANNVLTHGTGGLNIDGARVGASAEDFAKLAKGVDAIRERGGVMENSWKNSSDLSNANPANELGRWPANFIHDGSDEVVALFPDTKPSKQSLMGAGGIPNGANNLVGSDVERNQDFESVRGFNDSGSAARFFYCAKASKRDRNEGLDGLPVQRRAGLMGSDNDNENLDPVSERFRTLPSANHHPTVKPTTLMQYLVRLVTPPNGTVLDPFLGSGSTGKACAYEGFDFIGMELTAEYIPIATARIEFALADKDEQLDL